MQLPAAIISYIDKNNQVTLRSLAKYLNATDQETTEKLKPMIDSGEIIKTSTSSGEYYSLTRKVLLRPLVHYPYVTHRLIHLFNKGVLTNVTGIDVEPDYGYVTRINYIDGSHRITYGNDLGLNTGAACELAKDKGYTKYMLRIMGINCPEGEVFLLPNWVGNIRKNPRLSPDTQIRTIDNADVYIQNTFGYPAYIKPIDGSKGANVYEVYNHVELQRVFKTYEESKVRVAIIEKPVDMPDYRIVILDGKLISAYRRVPLTITGDGKHSIAQLIAALQKQYIAEGRGTRITLDDPRITSRLGNIDLTIDSTPAPNEKVILTSVSNLSAGGTSVDVTTTINQRWVNLAIQVASNFNLRLSGLDLACKDITDSDSPYSVIEVNAIPGLDHYAQSGKVQHKVVDALYTKVLNVPSEKKLHP